MGIVLAVLYLGVHQLRRKPKVKNNNILRLKRVHTSIAPIDINKIDHASIAPKCTGKKGRTVYNNSTEVYGKIQYWVLIGNYHIK